MRPTTVARLTPEALAVRVGDETVVWLSTVGALHLLDPIATEVLRRLDGVRTLQEVSRELARLYAAPAQQVHDDICALIERLTTLDVLVTEAP